MFKYNNLYKGIKDYLILIGIIFLLLFGVLQYLNLKQENRMIETSKKQFGKEANSIVSVYEVQLNQTLKDYTFWDEFVNAINVRDKDWFEANITLTNSFGFDYVLVFNKNYEIVFQQSSRKFFTKESIPQEAFDRLDQTRFEHFFLSSHEGLMEIGAATVHPTSDPDHNKTEPEGYMLVMKKWGRGFLLNMENISGAKVGLVSPNDAIVEGDRTSIYFEKELADWNGKPIAKIVFSKVLSLNFNGTRNMAIVTFVFAIFVLIVSNYIARKYINRPLKLVTEILKSDNKLSITELKKAPAEYGRIGSLFEAYVLQKEELEKAKEIAVKSDKIKSAFLANISHEIRTPMNHIVGFSGLLVNEPDDRKKIEFQQIIQNSSENLLKLINNLIDLSRIEAGDVTIQNKNFSVKEVFNELTKIFSLELLKREKDEIFLSYQLADSDYIINSDPLRIKQILSNLLNNAIKFTSKGEIYLSCYKGNNEMVFSVTDTGTGIPIEDQKIIFERFIKFDYQGLNTDGTGVGLTIVEKLVSVLNGKIWFDSTLGKGSTFYFSIPVNPVVPQTDLIPIHTIEEYIPINGKAINPNSVILVVEDNKPNSILMREMLRPLNLKLHFVDDGKDAIDYLKLNPSTDLVFMDIQLPLMDGYAATAEIRKFNQTIPIIAHTANAMQGDKEKALLSGCNDHISMPIGKEKLFELVKTYLSISKYS